MLSRSIRKGELVLLFINGVIGAGIFGLPSKVFRETGVYSLLALFVCALVIFVIVLCFAEVSSRFEQTGGPYLYALHSFGKLPAFLTGWLLLLTRFITYAALINLLVTYLSVFSPWFGLPVARVITITGITLILALINHVGVRNSTRVNNFLTIAKLLPLFIFIFAGFFFIDVSLFASRPAPDFGSFTSTVLLLVFAFGGFESVLVNTGEVRNPSGNLPYALLLATLIIASIYMLIQVVSIGSLSTLADSEKPLAEAAEKFLGKPGATMIAFGALFSVVGTLNAIMLVGSRLPYAFSVEKQFPAVFSFVHPRYNTPTWSLILFTVITILVSVTNSFIYAATLSAVTRVMIYAIVCISLLRLRKKEMPDSRYFRIPYGYVFAGAGILIAAWLLSGSGWNALRDVAVSLGIGQAIWFIMRLSRKKN